MEPSLLFNLVEFDQTILRPTASTFAQAMSSRAIGYSFANMVSAFFWLVFGLDAEYFPKEHVEAVFSQRFVQFEAKFRDLYQQWGYVFDPEFQPLLFGAFNRRTFVQRDESLRVHGHPIAKAAMRVSLTAESKLIQSQNAQLFTSILNFEPVLLEKVIADQTVQGSIDEGVINRNQIAGGFVHVVSYMRTLVDLSLTLRQEHDEIIGRRCASRIAQLTRWRVNRHLIDESLFKKTGLFVNEQYFGGAYDSSRVIDDIDGLLNEWGYTHFKSQTGAP